MTFERGQRVQPSARAPAWVRAIGLAEVEAVQWPTGGDARVFLRGVVAPVPARFLVPVTGSQPHARPASGGEE